MRFILSATSSCSSSPISCCSCSLYPVLPVVDQLGLLPGGEGGHGQLSPPPWPPGRASGQQGESWRSSPDTRVGLGVLVPAHGGVVQHGQAAAAGRPACGREDQAANPGPPGLYRLLAVTR